MHTHPPPNCPFCDPAIKQSTWLETTAYRIIYNIAPIVPGHSLVIPKRHVSSLLDLEEADMSELFLTARRAITILLAEFQGKGFDLSLQDGEAAGQTVPHLHIHIIPRKDGDFPVDQDWYEGVLDSQSRPRLCQKELQSIVRRLRNRANLNEGKIGQ